MMQACLSPGSLLGLDVPLPTQSLALLADRVPWLDVCDNCEDGAPWEEGHEDGVLVRRVPIERGYPGHLEGLAVCVKCLREEGLM